MPAHDTFKVPSKTITVTQEIKGNKFITTAGRVGDKDKAKEFIDNVRHQHKDATHNCYAFVAGNPYSTTDIGFGDDGEVPGTAGKPMLSVLQYKNIGEIAVVVTRYFGGTKLGTGGLVRAYTSSVQNALDKLPLETYQPLKTLTISYEYQYENTVRQILNKFEVQIVDAIYNEEVNMMIQFYESLFDKILEDLNNNLSGKIKLVAG